MTERKNPEVKKTENDILSIDNIKTLLKTKTIDEVIKNIIKELRKQQITKGNNDVIFSNFSKKLSLELEKENDPKLKELFDSLINILQNTQHNQQKSEKFLEESNLGLSKDEIQLISENIDLKILTELKKQSKDFNIIVFNLKLLKENFILPIQFLQNIGDIKLTKELLSFYKNSDFTINGIFSLNNLQNKFPNISLETLGNYLLDYENGKIFIDFGFNAEDFVKLQENKKDFFTYFKSINTPINYITSLSLKDFPFDKIKSKEHLFKGEKNENIYFLVVLFNKGKLSIDKIITYIELFNGQLKDKESDHIYIEEIDEINGGQTDDLKKYLEKNKKTPLQVLNLYNTGTLFNEKISLVTSRRAENEELYKNFNDNEIYIFLIKNNISTETIKPFYELNKSFSVIDLAFLANEENWNKDITKEKRLQIVKNYLEIDSKMSGKLIMNIVNSGYILDKDLENYEKTREYISYFYNKTKNNSSFNIDGFINALKFMEGELSNNDKNKIDNYTKMFGTDLSGFSIINLLVFEKKGGNFKDLKKQIKELESLNIGNAVNQRILWCINIFLSKGGFILDDIIQNNSYKQFTLEQREKATDTNVKIKNYLTLIQKAPKNSNLSNLSLDTYIELKANKISDENISYISLNYINDIGQKNKDENIYQYNQLILSFKNLFSNSLCEYLKKDNDLNIKIGQKEYKILGNTNILNGIMQYFLNNMVNNLDPKIFAEIINNPSKINWQKVIKEYEQTLNEYIETTDSIDTIFYIGSNHYYGEDKDNSLAFEQRVLENTFKGVEFLDYTAGSKLGNKIEKSNQVIDILEQYIKGNPNKKTMISINLHGDINGSGWTSKGSLKKEDFDKLNQLASNYTNLKVVVNSCNNGAKFSQPLKGDTISNSGDFYSTSQWGYISDNASEFDLNGLKNGDLNGDGVVSDRELNIYTTMTYKGGFVYFGSVFKAKNGIKIMSPGDIFIDNK